MKKTKLIPLLAGSSMLVAITPAIVGCTCSHGPTPPEPVITDNILVNNIGRQSATFTLDKSHFEPEEAKDGFSTTITLHKPDEVAWVFTVEDIKIGSTRAREDVDYHVEYGEESYLGSVIKITFEPFEPTEDTNISINVCAQQNTDVPIRVKFMGVGEKDVEFSFDPSYIEVKQYIDFPHITLTTNCDIGTISIINVFGDNPQSLESASFVEGSEYTITKQGPQNWIINLNDQALAIMGSHYEEPIDILNIIWTAAE